MSTTVWSRIVSGSSALSSRLLAYERTTRERREKMLARGATLGVTALVATVTVVINIVIRIVITAITKKGGIDTRTEEERVLFGQVSIAFVLNSVSYTHLTLPTKA